MGLIPGGEGENNAQKERGNVLAVRRALKLLEGKSQENGKFPPRWHKKFLY